MREKLCTTIIFYTEHFVVPFFLLNSLVAEKIKSLYIFFIFSSLCFSAKIVFKIFIIFCLGIL